MIQVVKDPMFLCAFDCYIFFLFQPPGHFGRQYRRPSKQKSRQNTVTVLLKRKPELYLANKSQCLNSFNFGQLLFIKTSIQNRNGKMNKKSRLLTDSVKLFG